MMNKIERGKLEKVCSSYFKETHTIYTGGSFREESFYPALKVLIEKCSQLVPTQEGANALVLPRKTEAGIPLYR
jgi:hypothetical protein